MSKTNLLLVSLIAAIPGGFLTFWLVSAFLGYADKMSMLFIALAAITLIASVAMTLAPVGIFLFTPKDEKEPGAKDAKKDDDVEEFGEDELEDVEEEDGDGFGDVIPDDFGADEESEESKDSDDADDLDGFEFGTDEEETGDDDFFSDDGDDGDGDGDALTELELDLDEEEDK